MLTWEDMIILLVAALLSMAMDRLEDISECPPYCAVDHMHSFRFPTPEGQGGKWDCQSESYEDCVKEELIAVSP